MSIACSVVKYSYGYRIESYDVRERKLINFWPETRNIHEIIGALATLYGNYIGKVMVTNAPDLMPYQLKEFNKDDFRKYGDLVYIPTKNELNFDSFLNLKVTYSIGDSIILFENNRKISLYKCIDGAGKKFTWKKTDMRQYGFDEQIDFSYTARMFGLEFNQTHAVFEDTQKNVASTYGPQFDNYGFKSLNFTKWADKSSTSAPLSLARNLISDPDVSVFIKADLSYEDIDHYQGFKIHDWGYIHIPKLVEEYEPRTDIMGIDLGSTRCVLAVSRNKQVHVIPVDNSSPGDLWMESVVSFDEAKPLFGKAAMRRLKTKPDYVVFDSKLLCSWDHRQRKSKQSIWPFKFNVKEREQPYLEAMTSSGLKQFSLAQINKVFLDRMIEVASEYQDEFNDGNPVKKAVITIPKYFREGNIPSLVISTITESAKLANIEVIDIIEETHADLLYYLSSDRYSTLIKPGMKIAMFDIGGGTCLCRIYEISQQNGRMYATCLKESYMYNDGDDRYSGRNIDDVIIEELEKQIPEHSRDSLKLRTMMTAKIVKEDLSTMSEIEIDLWDIDSHLNGHFKFTKTEFEKKLKDRFEDGYLCYYDFKQYPSPSQKTLRCRREGEFEIQSQTLNDVDIVFLAGGTCKIPFIQKWIGEQFPNAKIKIDGQLEIITATGAVIHALQVLSKEIDPYVKIEHNSNRLN